MSEFNQDAVIREREAQVAARLAARKQGRAERAVTIKVMRQLPGEASATVIDTIRRIPNMCGTWRDRHSEATYKGKAYRIYYLVGDAYISLTKWDRIGNLSY